MQEFNIQGRTTVTAEIRTQIDENPLINGQPPADSLGDLQSLTEIQNNYAETLRQNVDFMKQFSVIMPELLKQFRQMTELVTRNNNNGGPGGQGGQGSNGQRLTPEEQRQRRIEQLTAQGLTSFIANTGNVISSVNNANVGGAVTGVLNGASSGLNNLSRVAEANNLSQLASSLSGAGILTSVLSGAVKIGDEFANKYLEAMPTIFGTGRAFGTLNDDDSIIAYNRLNRYNKGTGLDIDSFQNLAQSLRKQGVGNNLNSLAEQTSLVGNIAQTTSRWAYATGGNSEQYAELAGLMSRYGRSKDVAGDFNYLVAAGQASGLNNTQIPEFLSGIQKVMEDGIAKGFTRSATEVADTMLMFSKMSGNNAFWQGEQGARLLNQANNGLANATGLSKTSDIIAYGAISSLYSTPESQKAALGSDLYLKDADYVNNMMLLEKGLNKDNFGAIMGSIQSADPGNTDAQIERIKSMFGVNYTGAARILKLYTEKGDKVTSADISNVTEAPENLNRETRYQQAINDIKEAVVNMSESVGEIKIAGMELISQNVANIAKWLGKEYGNREKEKELQELLENLTPEQQSYYWANQNTYLNRAKDEKTGIADLKKLANWSGWGKGPLAEDTLFTNKIIKPDGNDGVHFKSGETMADMVGAWSLNKKITNSNLDPFLHSFSKILDFTQDEQEAEDFIDWIVKDKNSDVKAARKKITDYSSDKIYSGTEQKETVEMLKKLYDIFKDGIKLTETQ